MSQHVDPLRYLIDRQEILDCIHRYCRGLDRHDDLLLESAFHPDAIDNHGSWKGGREEFVRLANHECHEGLLAHQHHVTTHNCDIDGDVAHTETYVLFIHRRGDERTVLCGGGRYIDRLERRGGEWRIARRRLVMDLSMTADGSEFGAFAAYPSGRWDGTDVSYERPLEIPS
ncbi:MAG TPA: nuclear transport factor 2 family protein [Solirubrobacteraceae bacterium]|nr:nuclear transport factor 2 family protein [Solirubrobacteraceae bacterium]